MNEHRHEHAVTSMCRVLRVARAGFYTWLHEPVSDHAKEDARLLDLIRDSYNASHGVYGARRIFGDLREAVILYSGSKAAFDMHAGTLETLGAANYLGADAGLASLYDLALLSGMCGVFVGSLHAFALVKSEGTDAERFLPLLSPWLTAMMGSLPTIAKAIDSGEYDREVTSNLAMQAVGIHNMLAASREQGVDFGLIEPMAKLIRQRVKDGFGSNGISGVIELIRRKDG